MLSKIHFLRYFSYVSVNSPCIIFFFLGDIEKRRRMRQKKMRDDKRRSRKIEMEENEKMGKCKNYYTMYTFIHNLTISTGSHYIPENFTHMWIPS